MIGSDRRWYRVSKSTQLELRRPNCRHQALAFLERVGLRFFSVHQKEGCETEGPRPSDADRTLTVRDLFVGEVFPGGLMRHGGSSGSTSSSRLRMMMRRVRGMAPGPIFLISTPSVDRQMSTLADQVGAGCAVLEPLIRRIESHVFAARRLHGDDTTVPVLAKGKTDTGRC